MARILVIAGGDWQVELAKKIKQMGHYVICSNLYPNSPAFLYADECEICDVLDKEKNLEIAKKYQPDAVITDQSDIAVPTVAYINENLGLPGIGTEKANLLTDKSLLRVFCKKNNIETPDFRICTCFSDALEMLKKYKKIIIKPIDSQSSRGVFTIANEKELKENWEETLSFSNRRKEFLAEEYIGGDEFTVDGLVVNKKHFPLCISIKEMYKTNPNISKTQTYTYSHPIYDYDELRRSNRNLIEKIGLPFGLTHSEYKYYNNKFYLIEAGARGGGSNLSAKIVPYMSEIDNYDYLIKSSLGLNVSYQELLNKSFSDTKCVIMRFFDFPEGIVSKVKGKELLENTPSIIDYQLNVKENDVLKNPKYGRLRPGHFSIAGNNLTELKKEADMIIRSVQIEYQK